MAKTKSKAKKKHISDVVLKVKTKNSEKRLNPFEVHVNREKFRIIGQKSKFDKGLPGVSRAKAIKKRKETLFQEYKLQNKSNKFLDRRIGERNREMTNEDKILARFTAERMKAHNKKTLFNLAEEEELTHRGRSITEVERFDNPASDDDEDDDRKLGALDANFVEEAHFGGGVLSKSANSRESVIDQLIADSKKRKIERQQTRERTLELTEKLDSDWKDLIPIINIANKNEEEEVVNKGRGDPFDIAMKELRFEARGKPSDKLKSEEEIVEIEAKRLEKLEEERLRRMRGEDTEVVAAKKQHRSADALDDNFIIEDDEDFEVKYDQDGNFISKLSSKETDLEEEEAIIVKPNPDDVDESEEDEESDEDEEESDDDDIEDLKTELEACDENMTESEDEDIKEEEDKKNKFVKKNKEDDKSNSNKNIKDSSTKNLKDCESDLDKSMRNHKEDVATPKKHEKDNFEKKTNESEDSDLKKNKETSAESLKKRKASESESTEKSDASKKKRVCFKDEIVEVKFGENAPGINLNKTKDEIRLDLMKRKELMDKARNELPYTYEAPKSYEELQGHFEGRSDNEITVIVERIIKCNHPKLREENKIKMNNLFAFLMQYLNDLNHQDCWKALDRLVPYLYDIMMFSPSSIAECLIEIIKEKQSDYSEKKYKYPAVNTFVFLKLVPLLFPASDKRHRVTSPSLVFITQMLQNCRVNNRRSIASGLFLVSLIYEYVMLSKRICPQALNYLCGLLHLASPASIVSRVVPPFKQEHRFLYLQQPFTSDISACKMSSSELSSKSSKLDDEFRVICIYTCLQITNMFVDLYETHHASYLLFLPFQQYLADFEVSKYPSIIKDLVKLVSDKINKLSSRELEKIAVSSKKPKVLRLYEPTIEPVYDTKRRDPNIPAEKAERDKLLHKIKKEKKGALREIRKDNAFISKIKFKQQEKNDAERVKKVKEIFKWGAQQNTEFGNYEKIRRKMKKF